MDKEIEQKNEQKNEEKRERIWELDLLRGIALILMVYFHVIYDLNEIYGVPVNYDSGINDYIGNISGSLFIFLAGLSSSLSSNNIARGMKILAVALVITLSTHIYNSILGIKFGILHFLSVSILTVPLLEKINKKLLPVLGVGVILSAKILTTIKVNNNILFPFGLVTADFISSDYYPLIPWYGVFLFGYGAGKFFYQEKRTLFSSFTLGENIISKAGRQTLLIYLIHQPLIVVVLTLYFKLRVWL